MRDVIPVWPIVLGNKVGAREQPLPRCLEPAKPWGKVIRLDDSHFSLEARRLPITFTGIHIFHTPEFSLGLASCLAAAYDKKLSTVNHHQTLTNPRLRRFEKDMGLVTQAESSDRYGRAGCCPGPQAHPSHPSLSRNQSFAGQPGVSDASSFGGRHAINKE